MSGSHDAEGWTDPPVTSFCHEALFYEGDDDLMSATERFVREGLAGDDRILVVLSGSKLDSLRGALGADAAQVQFADMDEVGSNPARIIPLWRTFVDSVGAGQSSRGIGEPVGASRQGAELAECQIHEELLNVAFECGSPFWLLCPYDTSSLEPTVLDAARHSHPYVTSGGQPALPSELYPGVGAMSSLRRHDLSPVPDVAVRFSVTTATVGLARRDLQSLAIAFGLGRWATDHLASAAHEVIANSLIHGGGRGEVSIWVEGDSLICEVKDRGLFERPMAGRIQPTTHGIGGRGLWMANQLCDLVQIRSEPDATVVRLHMGFQSRSSGPR